MGNRPGYLLLLAAGLLLGSCSRGSSETEEEPVPQTPVTVTSVNLQDLEEFVELNATSSFMEKSIVKAGISGYIQSQPVEKGKYVPAGQTLFTLITREARAIGNTISKLDPTFKFSGISSVKASKSGYISEINHQKGDFVQEGEQLAIISNSKSFVFLMDVPYELNRSVRNQSTVELILPDGEKLSGVISEALPGVDSVSQTQRIIIKVHQSHQIPENLIARVRIMTNFRRHAVSLPKEAVLANETQDEFWVMKLVNDSTAVKVPVIKGMETAAGVEITHPFFNPYDRIIVTGNYRLADTAMVRIVKK
jgi:multidrug efflux pump subunit AcrA (membrane-fusion protein)